MKLGQLIAELQKHDPDKEVTLLFTVPNGPNAPRYFLCDVGGVVAGAGMNVVISSEIQR